MRPIAMGTDVRDVKRFGLWIKSVGQEQPLLGFCACVFLLASLLIVPSRLQAEESSVAPAQSSADPAKVPTSKSPAAPPKEPSQIPVISQESKPPQQKSQVSAIEEPKAKGDKKGEEVKGDKKGEEVKGKKKGEEAKGDKKGEEAKGDKKGEEVKGDKKGEEVIGDKKGEEAKGDKKGEEAKGYKKGEEVKGDKKGEEVKGDKKGEEAKGDKKGEEGKEKEKNGAGKRTVSSLILTVKLTLLADARLFPYEIEVEDGSDEITLSGKVSSEAEKSVAAEIARTVPGVKSVANKIEIVKNLPDILAHRQDDILTQQVKDQFAKSATLKAASFDVKTEGGVVSLGGTVRFQVFVLEAAEAARQIPGVKAVKTDKVKIESEG